MVNGLFAMCVCEMDVAMLFLILVSIITMAVEGKDDDSRTILLSCWRWILSFFSLLDILKEKQSKKMSIILEPGESSGWRGEKEGNIL